MINRIRRHRPGRLNVTGGTGIGTLDVVGSFARRPRAVMTGDTGLAGEAVVECRHHPGCRLMAGITSQRSRNMVGSFARGDNIVVTAFTGANYLGMIHQRIHRCPHRSVVTCLALVGGIDMIC